MKILRAIRSIRDAWHVPPAGLCYIDPEVVAAGFRTIAEDLREGNPHALLVIDPQGEMPFTAEGWASYPTDAGRRMYLLHREQTGSWDIPDEEFDVWWERAAAMPGTTFDEG